MNRHVGPLRFGADGLARRGLLVRHLVMPGMLDETRAILRFVAADLGTGTYVDLMAQYHPAGLVGTNQRDDYREINRQLGRDEYELAAQYAASSGSPGSTSAAGHPACDCPRHQPRPAHDRPPTGRRTTNPRPVAAFPILAPSCPITDGNHRRAIATHPIRRSARSAHGTA